MLKNDEFWMDLALKQAKLADEHDEVPVGAVLISENEGLLASAYNRTKKNCDPCAHAEILVIREGAQRLKNHRLNSTTLYTTLEPCPMCVGAMIQARISRLVFATRDWAMGAAGSTMNLFVHPSSNHQLQIDEGIGADIAQQLLSDFFKNKRKKL